MRPVLQNQPQIGGLSQALLDSLKTMLAAITAGWNTQHAGDGTHAAVTATSVSVTPGTTVLNKLNLRVVEYTEPGATGGTVNNLTVAGLATTSCLRIQPASVPLVITGIDATGRTQGDLLLVLNGDTTVSTPADLVLMCEDAGSAAANRIAETTASPGGVGGFITVHGARGVWLMYDYQTTGTNGTRLPRWRIVVPA
jgi:hypothetical protein